jgi:hypothetical protein
MIRPIAFPDSGFVRLSSILAPVRAAACNKRADSKAMPSRLRIEKRLKPNGRLPELINLPNPFSGVIAVATEPQGS